MTFSGKIEASDRRSPGIGESRRNYRKEVLQMSNANQNSALGTAPMGKLMVKMAVPAVVAQVVNLLYNIVDRIYIGQGVAPWP